MAEEAQRPIIIIKKKKKGGHGHHGGAWKVAFADFMTAMFALFLVLWILTQSVEVKAAVASYFRHPTDYEGKPDGTFRGNNGLLENRQGRLDNPTNNLDSTESKSLIIGSDGQVERPMSVSGGLSHKAAEPGLRKAEKVESPLEQEKDEVRTFMKVADDLWMVLGMDPSFDRIKDNIRIQTIEDGLVIQLVDQAKSPLFEDGKCEFRSAVKQAIGILAQSLSKRPNNKIEIDGHGTELAMAFGEKQKWLASSSMADLTRAELERDGLKPFQITKVAGCADTRPLNPIEPGDPINRRISILVRPQQWTPERY